jgi:hypothetical protein
VYHHPELTEQTIWEMFEAERPRLVPYAGRFDGFHAVPASDSKTCQVRFDNNKYSVAAMRTGSGHHRSGYHPDWGEHRPAKASGSDVVPQRSSDRSVRGIALPDPSEPASVLFIIATCLGWPCLFDGSNMLVDGG